jgi:hypothetical protein
MFIGDGFFDGLMKAFIEVEQHSRYRVGMAVPMIPVNPHGYIRFLEKIGCLKEFENKFGKAHYDFCTHFEEKTAATLFLWERSLPLDDIAEKMRKLPFSYYICPHRFSIGAILFRRKIWEEMKGFNVYQEEVGLGQDEIDFAAHFLTMKNFYSYVMAENVLTGHYSFGNIDNPALLDEFYERNKELFDLKEDNCS